MDSDRASGGGANVVSSTVLSNSITQVVDVLMVWMFGSVLSLPRVVV